jgi:FtsZ-binding cell division protein ZapB
MAKTMRSADLEPLERLEEKVKLLVALLGRLRVEQARATEENGRLTRELDEARTRLSEFDGVSADVTALRVERDEVRSRVSSLLEQIEALNL